MYSVIAPDTTLFNQKCTDFLLFLHENICGVHYVPTSKGWGYIIFGADPFYIGTGVTLSGLHNIL